MAHGLGGGITETRPLAGGVAGTRVLYEARGHGGSPLGPEPVSYALLASDLDRVAAAHDATRAMGVSMGAGTILTLLAAQPARFERALLLLPPGRLAQVTPRLARLAQALGARDVEAVRDSVRADLPAGVGERVEPYVRARADFLLASEGVADVMRSLTALELDLSAVTARVLVIGQEDDPLHPADAARNWAAQVPGAEVVVLGPGAVFRERARLRELVAGFLG